jgi:excisionase family DNA binding protein
MMSMIKTAPDWLLTTVSETQGKRATIRQVADAIGVHPTTVRRLIDDGKLEVTQVGRRRFISRASIERFLGASPH